MTELILVLDLAVPVAVGALSLRHLRRVARPEEPVGQLPSLLVLAGKALVLQYALGLFLLPFVLLTRRLLAPWLLREGGLVGFTQPWAEAVWVAVNVLLLAAMTIPFFVSVASAALGLESARPLGAAVRGRYFRYWGLTWLAWLVIGGIRLVVLRALDVPLTAGGFNVPAEVADAMSYAVGLPVMAHFIGLWARGAMGDPDVAAAAGVPSAVEGDACRHSGSVSARLEA